MSTHALRFVSPAVIVAVSAISAGSAAAGDSLPLPKEIGETEKPVAAVSETVETDARAAGDDAVRHPAHSPNSASAGEASGSANVPEAANAAPNAHAEAPPASRLLRSLNARAARPAAGSPRLSPDGASADFSRTTADVAIGGLSGSSPVSGRSPVLHGCPRALLASLLAEATETADAVSALAIERETLALCRERQEIVNGIVALEGELQALLAEAQGEIEAPGTGAGAIGPADAPIVRVSAPVRVIEMPTPALAPAEAAGTATPPAPEFPSYSWFSIVGTSGDLRAGVSGGAGNGGTSGGTSVWFVREGDRLPGGVTVVRIVARPPSVHVGSTVEAALPYRPRPAGTAGPRGHAEGDGS